MNHLAQLIQWPSRAGTVVLLCFLGLVSGVAIAFAEPPNHQESQTTKIGNVTKARTVEQDVELFEAYIHKFVGHAPKWGPNRRVKRRARAIAELSVAYARGYGIKPEVTAVIMRSESGFRESAVGHRDGDDWGIMQINTRSWKRLIRDLDLATTEGQIEAGHRVLRLGYERCSGSDEQAIIFYSTGQCEVSRSHPKWRNIHHRIILLSRLRHGISTGRFITASL